MSFTAGDWTDDTDQLLLVLQALLATNGGGERNDKGEDKCKDEDQCLQLEFARRLEQWGREGFSCLGDQGPSGLGKTTKMIITRAGYVHDPEGCSRSVWAETGRRLAPNGAVMRVCNTTLTPRAWSSFVCLFVCLCVCVLVCLCVCLVVDLNIYFRFVSFCFASSYFHFTNPAR
jgi:ADP-ribosylglycohydrolase